jgi:transcriptional regulator with XRE-family HTH domain
MTVSRDWEKIPAVVEAARAGDYPRILRLARTAAGLTLAQAGRLAGYSPSALSRLETGRRRACGAKELRALASIYGISPHLMGLSPSSDPAGPTSLNPQSDDGGDPMRRRALLASGVLAVGGTILAPLDPVVAAGGMTQTLEDVLSGRLNAPAISARQLAAQIAAARADFRACRYVQLSGRLPRLLAQATVGRDQASSGRSAQAAGRVAEVYNIATDLLTKLHDDGMAWATSDRAAQAAQASGDPLIQAETTRLQAIVLRRTHHRAGAQRMIVDAARELAGTTRLQHPDQVAVYAQLLATAAYTAAINDDRDSAQGYFHEAEAAARKVAAGRQFDQVDLAVYKIGVARALGDFGAAVQHARAIDPVTIVSPARRARYWEDTALSLQGRGRPAAAYQALLAAEADAPQEVRYRPWAQQLTRELLIGDGRHALPDLRSFAARIGVTS